MAIRYFDELTSFREGEDEKYLVEYILADNGGFCHRASPFLMPIGTIFEHEYGTYEVTEIYRNIKHIVVYCERINHNTPSFNNLSEIKDNFN